MAADPAYRTDVLPLLDLLVHGVTGDILDLGCGEGQGMRRLAAMGRRVFGLDVNRSLLRAAARSGPVVRGRLPWLGWARAGVFDAATVVLVLEHLDDEGRLFTETARVVRPGGVLALVANHPAYTPPGAGPIVDVSDGEVLWRWGDYFGRASSDEPAGAGHTVRFHHRPLGDILNAAASAGWALERLEERPAGPEMLARRPELRGQEHFPRLLGVRWRRGGP